MTKKRVLFLCTGNSARSQMAEGIVNHYLGQSWQAFSAGVNPAGAVHPLAIAVMAEIGIDLTEHRSKSAEEFRYSAFDLVVTVCDHAARHCPTWLGAGEIIHLGFPDPAAAEGGSAAKMQIFRQVRDAIHREIVMLLTDWDRQSQPQPFAFVAEFA
ncbi:MAG TPA: arsenate reductase ArsC [Anaerolineae bacterium]|nr:arsenate reductase ArsC [Anaerolineae bacterium]HQI87261.1 arsenate reductase ArsC [Anaerolineae bacterium]